LWSASHPDVGTGDIATGHVRTARLEEAAAVRRDALGQAVVETLGVTATTVIHMSSQELARSRVMIDLADGRITDSAKTAGLPRDQPYEVVHSKSEVRCDREPLLRFGSNYQKEKVMIRQVNSESAVTMDAVADSREMRELSTCELDMIGGGFIPGALADATHLRLVTGSDGNSYLN
jgi:hypothetical protein